MRLSSRAEDRLASRGGSGSRCAGVRPPARRRGAPRAGRARSRPRACACAARRRARRRSSRASAQHAADAVQSARRRRRAIAKPSARSSRTARAAATTKSDVAAASRGSRCASCSATSCPPAMSPPITRCATFTRGTRRRARSRRRAPSRAITTPSLRRRLPSAPCPCTSPPSAAEERQAAAQAQHVEALERAVARRLAVGAGRAARRDANARRSSASNSSARDSRSWNGLSGSSSRRAACGVETTSSAVGLQHARSLGDEALRRPAGARSSRTRRRRRTTSSRERSVQVADVELDVRRAVARVARTPIASRLTSTPTTLRAVSREECRPVADAAARVEHVLARGSTAARTRSA